MLIFIWVRFILKILFIQFPQTKCKANIRVGTSFLLDFGTHQNLYTWQTHFRFAHIVQIFTKHIYRLIHSFFIHSSKHYYYLVVVKYVYHNNHQHRSYTREYMPEEALQT